MRLLGQSVSCLGQQAVTSAMRYKRMLHLADMQAFLDERMTSASINAMASGSESPSDEASDTIHRLEDQVKE